MNRRAGYNPRVAPIGCPCFRERPENLPWQ